MPGKLKKIDELVQMLKSERKEVTPQSIMSRAMSYATSSVGTSHESERYAGVTPGLISQYLRYVAEHTSVAS